MGAHKPERKPSSLLSIMRNALGTLGKESESTCGVSCGIHSDPIPGGFRKKTSSLSRRRRCCCVSLDGRFSSHGNVVTVNDAGKISASGADAPVGACCCNRFNLPQLSIPRFAPPTFGTSSGESQWGSTDEEGRGARAIRDPASKLTVREGKGVLLENWLREQHRIGTTSS
ncbi:uncharacterized protein Tco025E_07697 [Trypanosoma conorhini]|uniref:Uncharacterized protein n=1 Tax=Trypanosoma conorhini TaxID=83891 RepID=A0A422NJZ1_9TRYP|nr:uncharacterized protein Tco025E_07697 [Trypanosoma conorhini]RNF05828.1 hypothetical protein Tco025E_07697 [Trypanosoma conorhini]